MIKSLPNLVKDKNTQTQKAQWTPKKKIYIYIYIYRHFVFKLLEAKDEKILKREKKRTHQIQGKQ